MKETLNAQGLAAKAAARKLAVCGSAQKDKALSLIAEKLIERKDEWLAANAEDLRAAEAAGMRPSLQDRLKLTEERIQGVAEGVRQLIALPDPIGKTDKMETRPNGLVIGRRRVPLGVIAIIFEARPNVAVDAASLCLKSGNACILRGGKEAFRSNQKAVEIMREALAEAGLSPDCIALVQSTDRESAEYLMHMNEYVDVLIPRGGAGLIRTVAREASVPVIRTGEGVCHIYVDRDADLEQAGKIVENAKCSRPSVCNAVECLLVHRDVAAEFLPAAASLLEKYRVELRCCKDSLAILQGAGCYPENLLKPASEEDWDAEYDDYILAVKLVENTEEAMDFIHAHGSGHSEAILTENYSAAQRFLNEVDAAAVYVNASTRFTDGGEFGLGAEIGISTQKLHARGPMGLEELTSCKYVIYGSGQIR